MSTEAGSSVDHRPARTRRRPFTVALVGADGAGKSTVTRLLERASLPRPVKTIYMGVNLEASSLMLPTTRMLLAFKRSRGGRPDLVANSLTSTTDAAGPAQPGGWKRSAKDGARLTVWMLEEWLRQLVATGYGLRGYIVVFDRHFFADYYQTAIATKSSGAFGRLHGWMLQHAYPKPNLVVCLDADAEVLYARKPESSVEWLDRRRREYLELEGVVPALVVVDAERPLQTVLSDVVDSITTHWEGTAA